MSELEGDQSVASAISTSDGSSDNPADTDNTESILINLEEAFKHRYTEADDDYMTTVNTPLPPPPCVENWYSRPKRTYDWSRNQEGGEHSKDNYRGNRGHGNRRGNWDRNQGHDSDRRDNYRQRDSYGDRNRGYGNRDQRQSYGQRNERYGDRNQGYSDRNQGYGDRNQGYGDRNQGYGDRNQGYGHQSRNYGQSDNRRREESRGDGQEEKHGSGRVLYAGMKQPDGNREHQHQHRSPYSHTQQPSSNQNRPHNT